MASTEKLSSGKYRGVYRTASGQKRSVRGTFTHKAEAKRAAAGAEADTRKLGWRDPRAAARTWGDWCDEWQRARILAPTTALDEQRSIKNHIRPRWGDVPLIDITRHDVKAWAAEIQKSGRALATVKKITTAFSTSLAAAVDAEILTANPASRLKLGTPDNTIERYLTQSEQAALLDYHRVHPLSYALTAVLIDSGLRWGEATALTLQDIDLERRTIRVRSAWSHNILQPYTKSKRRRTVPLTQRVADALKIVMPTKQSTLIFSHDGSTQLDVSSWRFRHHDRAIEALGMPHTRIHDLRHTYASTLLQAGIPLAEVGKLMGHLSVITTARYAHLSSTPSAAVLAALGDTTSTDPEPPRGTNVGHSPDVDGRNQSQSTDAEIIDFASKRQIRS